MTNLGAIFNIEVDENLSMNLSTIPIYADRKRTRIKLAKEPEKTKIELLLKNACSYLNQENNYMREWNRQSYQKVVSQKYRIIGTVYRLLKFTRRGKIFADYYNHWLLERDRDIFIGAVKYICAQICKYPSLS